MDTFDIKNSNIIEEGIIWNKKDYFPRQKFKT